MGLEPQMGGRVIVDVNYTGGRTTQAQGTWSGEYRPGSGMIYVDLRIKNPTPTTMTGTMDMRATARGTPGKFTVDPRRKGQVPGRLPKGPVTCDDNDVRTAGPNGDMYLHTQGRLRSGDGDRQVTVNLNLKFAPQTEIYGRNSLTTTYDDGNASWSVRAIFVQMQDHVQTFLHAP